MTTNGLLMGGFSLFVLAAAWTLSGCGGHPAEPPLQIGYASAWKEAQHRCVPGYPTNSLDRRSEGLAVSEITINTDGTVTHAEILEAPDDGIAKSVHGCAMQWRLPAARQQRLAKLYFYFVESRGRAGVYVANDLMQADALVRLKREGK